MQALYAQWLDHVLREGVSEVDVRELQHIRACQPAGGGTGLQVRGVASVRDTRHVGDVARLLPAVQHIHVQVRVGEGARAGRHQVRVGRVVHHTSQLIIERQREAEALVRDIRALGVYSEIYPHDITAAELKALPNVKGVIINGGVNNVVDGVAIDVNKEIYSVDVPFLAVDHIKADCSKLDKWPEDEAEYQKILKDFVFDICGAAKNWNMKNFIDDQVELIRRQVGDKKVLLALSGGVDSSVVAALLIKAIGNNLVCVHVNLRYNRFS